jgi:S-DNA-T family DNA segregation ATPase FtsK/SpoIIIE
MAQPRTPRWLRRKHHEQDTAAWTTMVRRRWADTAEGAHLARHTTTAGGMPHTAIPRAATVDTGPPVALLVEMMPGQVPADFHAQTHRIAEGMGAATVRITPHGPGRITITLLDRDPLHAATPLPTRPAGTTTRQPVLLGTNERGQPVTIDFTQRVHLLIQGRTGSGKSRLSYGILQQLATAPDAIIAGSDPSSVLLRPFHASRHADWQVLGADPYRHADLLTHLVEVMDHRMAAIPPRCDVLPVTADHPMLFIVLEEWLALLSLTGTDKRLRDRITTAARRLAAEAGKVNIRLIMLPQRAEANEMGGGLLRAQFAYRLTLPVDNVESIRLLHPTVPTSLAEHHVTHATPGTALYQAPGRDLGRLRTPQINDYTDYWDTITTLTTNDTGRTARSHA